MTRASQLLWQSNSAVIEQALQTSWLRELAQGTLSESNLASFLSVDTEFLAGYWRCLGLLCFTAETGWEHQVLAELSHAIAAERGSVSAQEQVAAKHGAQQLVAAAAAPTPTATRSVSSTNRQNSAPALHKVCQGYLRLLMRHSRGLLEELIHASGAFHEEQGGIAPVEASWRRARLLLVAAMVPCMSLYAFIGRKLSVHIQAADDHDPRKSARATWVATYSSPKFQELAESFELLLDLYAEQWCSATSETLERLVQQLNEIAYAPAMQFEMQLFAEACP
jgi:thiaminase